jgi:hypothetical protein
MTRRLHKEAAPGGCTRRLHQEAAYCNIERRNINSGSGIIICFVTRIRIRIHTKMSWIRTTKKYKDSYQLSVASLSQNDEEAAPGGCTRRLHQEAAPGGCTRRLNQEAAPGGCVLQYREKKY